MNPRFPLYIVSKGRAFPDHRLTHYHLHETGVPYYVIVEEQEVERYRRVIRGGTVLVLDRRFHDEYDTFDDLGSSRSKGPGPARNFAWAHAISIGAPWHWVMDDNIDGFFRLNYNLKTPVSDGTIFRCMEDFALRYENVAMAGPNYFMFASRKSAMPPFVTNTRIYSCNLIRNDLPLRWRGRYNEDTDLSIRMLLAGWCTVQFNAFLQFKAPTQTIKGGNTAEFYHAEGKIVKGEKYARDGTLAKSQMIVDMHPDLARLVWRFGRWHHYVDYSIFRRNRLRYRSGIELRDEIDNYGMRLLEWPTAEDARAWVAEQAKRRATVAITQGGNDGR